eukprot:3861702-Rhodomonas_salina.2
MAGGLGGRGGRAALWLPPLACSSACCLSGSARGPDVGGVGREGVCSQRVSNSHGASVLFILAPQPRLYQHGP